MITSPKWALILLTYVIKEQKYEQEKKELSPKAIPISLLQKPSSSKSASTLPPLPLSLLLLLASEPSNTKAKKTDPNINITGTDENYLLTSGYKISDGRNFSIDEVNYGRHVIIIGQEVKNIVFGSSNPIGEVIAIEATSIK